MATVSRDGSINFKPTTGLVSDDYLKRACADFALAALKQMERSDAYWRILQLRSSCGVKTPMRIRLANGTGDLT